jgi:hypothetical protein
MQNQENVHSAATEKSLKASRKKMNGNLNGF